MEHVQEILSGFGAVVGLPGLALDADNGCTLQFDSMIVNVEYLPDMEEFYFYAKVGDIPANDADRLRLYALFMNYNCFYRRTSGGVLGADADQGAVVYTNKVGTQGLTANMFGDYMEAFVNLAEGFGRDLRDETAGGDGDGGPDESIDPSMMTMRV